MLAYSGYTYGGRCAARHRAGCARLGCSSSFASTTDYLYVQPENPGVIHPTLHHLAQLRHRHMTVVVAEANEEYVARQDLAPIAEWIAASERRHALRPARAGE
jgi:hypothetical protein